MYSTSVEGTFIIRVHFSRSKSVTSPKELKILIFPDF